MALQGESYRLRAIFSLQRVLLFQILLLQSREVVVVELILDSHQLEVETEGVVDVEVLPMEPHHHLMDVEDRLVEVNQLVLVEVSVMVMVFQLLQL